MRGSPKISLKCIKRWGKHCFSSNALMCWRKQSNLRGINAVRFQKASYESCWRNETILAVTKRPWATNIEEKVQFFGVNTHHLLHVYTKSDYKSIVKEKLYGLWISQVELSQEMVYLKESLQGKMETILRALNIRSVTVSRVSPNGFFFEQRRVNKTRKSWNVRNGVNGNNGSSWLSRRDSSLGDCILAQVDVGPKSGVLEERSLSKVWLMRILLSLINKDKTVQLVIYGFKNKNPSVSSCVLGKQGNISDLARIIVVLCRKHFPKHKG